MTLCFVKLLWRASLCFGCQWINLNRFSVLLHRKIVSVSRRLSDDSLYGTRFVCRACLSHSAALFQLSSPPLFLFSSFPPPSVPLAPFLLPHPPPRPEAATPPSFSLLPFAPLLFPFRPSISLRSGTPYTQLGDMGIAVGSPSGVWGGAPVEIEFGAF